ncbi:unnamed protein product [Penicillium olsonii]|nr:unnamed protein product [Penicillium olsonii]
MIRARRDAQLGIPPGDPRYGPSIGRSRYRERRSGYPPQLYGPPQNEYTFQQQQYNQPQRYDHQYVNPQPNCPQQPFDARQAYGQPQQYGSDGRYSPPPNGLYPGSQGAPPPSQLYTAQIPQIPPPPSNRPQVCVIPQIMHKRFSGENMSPFVRVRVPQLEQQISSHELIIFIDELNEAFLANPALQATNQAANIAGMAPSMIVQLVGVGVNVAAGISSTVTTKTRTKKYLAKANKELFHARGLHVQMCKTDKMLEYAGLGGQENVFLRQQYRESTEHAMQMRIPMNGPMGSAETANHPIMHRMAALGDRVMPLSFDYVEAATKPEGFWKKWGAKEATKADQKQMEKMMKEQAKEERRSGRGGGRLSSRRQERQGKKKAKEANKILWIVIAPKANQAGGDEEWDSGSDSDDSGSHKH